MSNRNSKKRNSIRFYDVPQEDISSTIWIPDRLNVWIRAKIIQQEESVLHVQSLENGALITVDTGFEDIHKLNPSVVPDMTSLIHIHEPGILYNLRERSATFNPYTYMGTVMIAVNPLRKLPDVCIEDYYTGQSIAVGQSSKPREAAPHPFAMAELAYQQLNFSGANQSLVVSGESGAGKTETAKILLKYLVRRCLGTASGHRSSEDQLDNKLLQSSPILESFGNAKTTRNNNSSRFGKFMKLLFASNGNGTKSKLSSSLQINGAVIETYLLEKSRVVRVNEEERNYHVFYQLLEGCRKSSRRNHFASVQIPSAEHFRMLNQSDCIEIEDVDDSEDFEKLWDSLLVIGLTNPQIVDIMKSLLGLLHLGNIAFNSIETAEGAIANIENPEELQGAATYLGVPSESLKKILTDRSVWTRGELFTIALSAAAAGYARDACVKYLYEKLFENLVGKINASLMGTSQRAAAVARSAEDSQFIGVLDIFGFENFTVNTFDQLLINFANESLQNTFNAQIFDAEIKLYESENIKCSLSSKPENVECIDLFLNKNYGIFQLLDNTCRQPKPLDDKYCDELHKKLGANRYFPTVHPKEKKYNFCVRHFAGKIKYTVAGGGEDPEDATSWVDKNNDASPDGLGAVCEQSALEVVRSLCGTEGSAPSAGSGKKAERRPSQLMKPTLIASFTRSMSDLNAVLNSTCCLFIRCIKPNLQMRPDHFDNVYVVEQLRSLGILQTCEVLKVGLPTRISYQELKVALSSVISQVQHLISGAAESVVIACILQAYDIPSDIYRLGRTKVFFKAGQFSVINDLLQSSDLLSTSQKQEISNKIVSLLQASQAANEIVKSMETKLLQYESSLKTISDRVKRIVGDKATSGSTSSSDVVEFNAVKSRAQQVTNELSELEVNSKAIAANVEETANNVRAKTAGLDAGGQLQTMVATCQSKLAQLQTSVVSCNASSKKYTSLLSSLQAYYDSRQCVLMLQHELDELLASFEQAKARYLEARDGAMRCQLNYTEESAEKCEESLNNLQFRVEGIEAMLANPVLSAPSASKQVNFEDFKQEVEVAKEHSTSGSNSAAEIEALVLQINKQLDQVLRANRSAAAAATAAATSESCATSTADDAAGAAAAGAAAGKQRRTSVKYTAKDLAAMRAGGLVPPAKPTKPTSLASTSTAATVSTASAASTPTTSTEAAASTPTAVCGVEQGVDSLSIDSAALPEGWKECLDKVSGRLFYVNKTTKERQWKHPGKDASVKASTATAATAAASSSTTAKKATTAKTSTAKAGRTGTGVTAANGSNDATGTMTESVHTVERLSKRMRLSDKQLLQSMIAEADQTVSSADGTSNTTNPIKSRKSVKPPKKSSSSAAAANSNSPEAIRAEKVKALKAVNCQFNPCDSPADVSFGDLSITQMEHIGLEAKSGFLMKQSSILGIWKKRWFVLEGGTISYYDRPQDAYGNGGKHFHLRPDSLTSYTSTENCFCIKAFDDAHDSENWFLVAKDESEMESWMIAINSHIHMVFTDDLYSGIERVDYWEMGELGTTVWKVPSPINGVAKRPVGIRTHPSISAPRTGEGIFPGEAIEVIQMIELEGNNFLRLANDRGWLFEYHAKAKYAICQRVEGRFHDVVRRYRYDVDPSSDRDEQLRSYLGPSLENYSGGVTLSPGTEFEGVGEWQEADSCDEDGNTIPGNIFVKLQFGQGWLLMHHEVTGEAQLVRL